MILIHIECNKLVLFNKKSKRKKDYLIVIAKKTAF